MPEFLKDNGLNVFTIADNAFYIQKGVPIMQTDGSSCATLGLMISKQLLRDDGKALKELLAKAKESGTKELELTPDILKYSQSNRLVANLNCNKKKLANNKDGLTVGQYRKLYENKVFVTNDKLYLKSEKINLLNEVCKAKTKEEIESMIKSILSDSYNSEILLNDIQKSKLYMKKLDKLDRGDNCFLKSFSK